MKRIKTAILLATAAVAVTACNRKPVVPEFGMLPIDTLLGTQDNGCNIEYRFATIGNAGKSAALEAIEKANIEYFFELEEFAGTARQAADSAILQVAADIVLPEGMSQGIGAYEISVESEGSVQDTLVTYSISRWSFTGGAHGMYGIEYHTYSITDGYELSLADLFTAPHCIGMEKACSAEKTLRPIRDGQRRRAGRTGLLPGIHRPDGKFPDHSRRHHLLLQPLRDRMLCTRGRRSGDRPRGAGAVLTSGRDAAPAYPGSRLLHSRNPHPGTIKKGRSLTTQTFFFCRGTTPFKK